MSPTSYEWAEHGEQFVGLAFELGSAALSPFLERVSPMPGEVVFAACHGSSEDLPSKVLTRVGMGMLGGLDGSADNESAVVSYGDVASLEQLVASEPARGHDDMSDIAPFWIAALGPLLDVGCDKELDLELPATQVTRRNWADEQHPPQVALFDAPRRLNSTV